MYLKEWLHIIKHITGEDKTLPVFLLYTIRIALQKQRLAGYAQQVLILSTYFSKNKNNIVDASALDAFAVGLNVLSGYPEIIPFSFAA